MSSDTALISLRQVRKTYTTPNGPFAAVDGVSLEVAAGEFVAIAGPSGSGKSTLLNLLAGIERADAGELQVAGAALHGLSESALTHWRGRQVGVVFQFFQLLPTLTVLENVLLPMDFCHHGARAERPTRAMALLQRLGIAEQAHKFPAALSGGQQQRVAVARALANEPPLLLADEPTGNLDSASAAALLDVLQQLVREQGVSVVMVTHEAAAMRRAERCIHLRDGRVVAREGARADHAAA